MCRLTGALPTEATAVRPVDRQATEAVVGPLRAVGDVTVMAPDLYPSHYPTPTGPSVSTYAERATCSFNGK